jgi:hypothetical protein
MRSDFHKVIIARGRRRNPVSYGNRRGRSRAAADEAGRTEPMGALYGWDRKEVSDLLSPLERFLRRRVGRPWDKVHGEMRADMRGSWVLKDHLLTHAREFVLFDLRLDGEGRLVDLAGRPLSEALRWKRLYVDPRDGILKAVKPRRR